MSTIKTWNEIAQSCDFLNGRPIASFSAPELMKIEIKELREALKGEQECNVRLDVDWQRCMKEKSELQAKLSNAKAAQPVLEKLREYALQHAPDYPGIEKAKPWEQLYALVTTLEGIKAANDDLHKLPAQPLTKEKIEIVIDILENNACGMDDHDDKEIKRAIEIMKGVRG